VGGPFLLFFGIHINIFVPHPALDLLVAIIRPRNGNKTTNKTQQSQTKKKPKKIVNTTKI